LSTYFSNFFMPPPLCAGRLFKEPLPLPCSTKSAAMKKIKVLK